MFDYFVSAGHSNADPGAVRGTIKEADIAVAVRNAVAEKLKAAGKTVTTDGSVQVNEALADAIKRIKTARISIEIHCNASENTAATGTETIALPAQKKLAQTLSASIAQALGTKVRGDAGWIDQSQSARGKLGFVNNGGLIVELFFLSNPKELASFNVDKVASAIAATLLKF